MENTTTETDSHIPPPNRWRRSPNYVLQDIQNIRLISPNPALTEHLILKRAVKDWQTPVHSDNKALDARLASFKEWPYTAVQTPESLSEAGFFYSGKTVFTISLFAILSTYLFF